MGSIGGGEVLLIFLVILLVFGAKRIPEIARGLGRGIREFKEATRDIQRELTLEDPSPMARRSPSGQTASPYTSAPRAAAPSNPVENNTVENNPVDQEMPRRRDTGDVPPVSASETEGAPGSTT